MVHVFFATGVPYAGGGAAPQLHWAERLIRREL